MVSQFLVQQGRDLGLAVVGQHVGPAERQPLDRLVDGLAARQGLRGLTRPVELTQVQHIAGVDSIGIAHPALDAGDRQLTRAAVDRGLGRRAFRQPSLTGHRRIEGAGGGEGF